MTDTTEVMRASTEMSHGYHVTTAKVAMGLNLKYVTKNVITYLQITAKIVPFDKFFKF